VARGTAVAPETYQARVTIREVIIVDHRGPPSGLRTNPTSPAGPMHGPGTDIVDTYPTESGW
jgi:hypothetical protein